MASKQQPKVVVIGGGYAGTAVATALDKKFDVVLVDRNEVMYHNIAGPRAAADTSGEWISRVLVPRRLKRGRVVKGTAQRIDAAAKQVVLESGERLPFDYAVIATGSSVAWPFKASTVSSKEDMATHLRVLHEKIKASKSIVVIGGGATGTELAGELRYFNPDKQVTLIQSGQHLIGEKFAPKFYKKIDEQLGELGVTVISGTRASVHGGTQFPGVAAVGSLPVPTVGPCVVRLGDKEIAADLVFTTVGSTLDNQLVKDSFPEKLNAAGEVTVEDTMQVAGFSNIFACGDVSSRDRRKLAFVAKNQSLLVVKNITAHAKGGKLSTKDGLPPGNVGAVALGPRLGVIQLPFGNVVLGRIAMRGLKSKTLMWQENFKQVGEPLPAST